MSEDRICISCGKSMVGRADKKFCQDQCRSEYYNKKNAESSSYMRKVNHILKKNRRILEKLNNKEKPRYNKERLLTEGFNFSYFTNLYKTKEGKVYYYCYEQGVLPLDNDWFLLVLKTGFNES
jgi:DNA-directed RNA polymerase subunit M/transcription elongation factor TFIIS